MAVVVEEHGCHLSYDLMIMGIGYSLQWGVE